MRRRSKTAPTVQRSPRGLAALGAACARRPLLVIAVWLVLLIVMVAARQLAGGTFSDNVQLSRTQANSGLLLLDANQPAAGGYAAQIVFHVGSGSLLAQYSAVEATVNDLRALPHVLSVSDPLSKGLPAISSDGRTALSTIRFDVQPKTLGKNYLATLDRAVSPARTAKIQVEYGGALDGLTRPSPNDRRSELIGFAVALVVLLIGFGSVAAAVLPLLSALLAVLIGVSLLSLVASVLTFGTTAPTLALMIGLGVGIDYALFLATRYRQQIADGVEPVAAAGWTVAKSGQAVLVAAGTVSLALLGLYASGMTFIGQLGLAAVFSVLVAAAAALTLVPAALGLLGRRIDVLKVRKPVAESGTESDGWHRYAHLVARRPWWFLVVGVAILAVLTVPLLSIQLGHIDNGADPTSYTDRRAYDLIAQAFGAGANGTFTIVIDTRGATSTANQLAQSVGKALAATDDVARVSAITASSNGKILVGTVFPASSPQDKKTAALFDQLVHTTLPQALAGDGAKGYVTGNTALQLQFRDKITARLPLVIAVIVVLAFLLLMTTFRSLLIALKAAVLNLMSIGAAYGVIVAVFQFGWGRSLFGVTENVPIESYIPVIMFAIVFGLSMDYEVFLLSRVKEAWEQSGNNTEAVATGLARTARVITCAALIMTSVFLSFVLSTNVVVKMLAIGLSVSVLVDATIVRLILVPATMTLLGRANWWLPSWLDCLLPQVTTESDASTRQPLPAGDSD